MSGFCECGSHCPQCDGCGKPECECACSIYGSDDDYENTEW